MTYMARAFATLLGVAAAGTLLWLATWMRDAERGEYWAAVGLYAAAGLVLALSQLLGGWTKWGMPRVSPEVLVLGFLPALAVGGWVVAAHEPSGWFADTLPGWSEDIGVGGLVDLLVEAVPAIAFRARARVRPHVRHPGPFRRAGRRRLRVDRGRSPLSGMKRQSLRRR